MGPVRSLGSHRAQYGHIEKCTSHFTPKICAPLESQDQFLLIPYGKFFVLTDFLLITYGKFFVLVDFYQLCFCHAPDDFFKAHLEAPSWFNIEMTKSCRIQGESVHLLAYSVNSTCCAERLELTPEKPESLDQPQRCLDRLLRALGQPLRGLSQSL